MRRHRLAICLYPRRAKYLVALPQVVLSYYKKHITGDINMNNYNLTESEENIMLIIWENEGISELHEITHQFNLTSGTTLTPATISTILYRLVHKGFLYMHCERDTAYYSSIVSIEEYRLEYLQKITHSLFMGDIGVLKKYVEHIASAKPLAN